MIKLTKEEDKQDTKQAQSTNNPGKKNVRISITKDQQTLEVTD